MLKKVLLVVVLLLLIVGVGGYLFFSFQMPKLKDFDYLREPQVRMMPNQKMLVVELKGKPAETSGKVIAKLFQIYFKLPGVSKTNTAPIARWPLDFSTPSEEWLGRFALRIPESVNSLPEDKTEPKAKIETWEYGQVVEILHIGPYDQETPTIEKLKKYIVDNGFQIVGEHEEEYIKGPGMFIKVNAKDYLTIIRYRVVKK